MQKQRLGDVLIARGVLRQEELDRALAIQLEKNLRLGEVLLQDLRVPKAEVAKAIEQIQGIAYAECPPFRIAPEALALISHSIALKCCALPLEIRPNALVVAMAEPQDIRVLEELRFRAGRPVSPRFSFREDILAGIRKFYTGGDVPLELVLKETATVSDALPPVDAEEEAILTELEFIVATSREENREGLKELRSGVKKRSLAVRCISMILARAARAGASDLHIEPLLSGAIVRMRVDGTFRELMRIPAGIQMSVISRMKTLVEMDTNEQRLPQDGRFLVVYDGRRLDVRVSTLPTHFGEKIVMRILDPRPTLVTFEELPLSKEHYYSLTQLLNQAQGMLIVTGPSDSGKSTTLYAALNSVSSPEHSIVSVEDPVEYVMDGITQVQVNAREGFTVSVCLRRILRQNPKVIMVGEISDGETADTALRASQTGHLVVTTLNTNDTVGVITFLRDLGVPSYLISSVSSVVGQRLVRALCMCRKELPATEPYIQSLEAIGMREPVSHMFEPVGCPDCNGTGYKGRVGIYEVLMIDGMMRDAIHADTHADEIRGMLRSVGFRRMQEDALEKVCRGATTLDEVMRLVPIDTTAGPGCLECGRGLMPSFTFCPFCGTAVTSDRVPVPQAQ